MKKRSITAIIITAVIVFITNKYWFINKSELASFDFMLFMIILILGYLLAYKLSNYVAEFNTIKGKSRLEIIFLTVFFVFLFIPMLRINQDNISKQENRTLAKWKPLISEENVINFKFGNDFNEWFNDRFNLRQIFININDLKLLLSKNLITKDVLKGSDGWLFLGYKEAKESYANNVMFTNEELSGINSYLKSINDYCKMHNKKFYFIIAPDKSKIYSEYYPKQIKKISDTSKAMQLVDYIKKHSDVKVIYPINRLISQKGSNLLYYKCDTHWNLLGAYYGYSELMNIIRKDYPNIPVYKIKEYSTQKYYGDLYGMTPKILRKPDNTIYTIPKVNADTLCKKPKELREDIICSNKNSNINLLMYRDSYAISLIPYIAHSFGKSKYIWNFDVNPDSIQNADIIILEIVERSLPALVGRKMEAK